jgi:hypothetical protein
MEINYRSGVIAMINPSYTFRACVGELVEVEIEMNPVRVRLGSHSLSSLRIRCGANQKRQQGARQPSPSCSPIMGTAHYVLLKTTLAQT